MPCLQASVRVPHLIVHEPGKRGTVTVSSGEDGPVLVVHGERLHLPRRIAEGDVAAAVFLMSIKIGLALIISGAIAERNLAGMAAYGASKAALLAFDQAVAREARRRKLGGEVLCEIS